MEVTRDGESIGKMVFELYYNECPLSVDNFMALCSGKNAESLYYKNSPFHRIVTGFMAQGGDITNGDGTGGMSIYGENFADENIWLRHTKRGILSMANKGRDTNNSQFFVTFDECGWLDGHHTIIGELIEGYDTLEMLELGGSKKGTPT